jgi:uncharacterized protein YbjQ (UPF0145 family)
MLMTTTLDIPGRQWIVLGIVTASVDRIDLKMALNAIGQDASKLGADAVIGIQFSAYTFSGSPGGRDSYSSPNRAGLAIMGTAVKFS